RESNWQEIVQFGLKEWYRPVSLKSLLLVHDLATTLAGCVSLWRRKTLTQPESRFPEKRICLGRGLLYETPAECVGASCCCVLRAATECFGCRVSDYNLQSWIE